MIMELLVTGYLLDCTLGAVARQSVAYWSKSLYDPQIDVSGLNAMCMCELVGL